MKGVGDGRRWQEREVGGMGGWGEDDVAKGSRHRHHRRGGDAAAALLGGGGGGRRGTLRRAAVAGRIACVMDSEELSRDSRRSVSCRHSEFDSETKRMATIREAL